jgi:dihydrofolate reductase
MDDLTLVMAIADDGAVGLRGKVPWEIPEDRRHFAEATVGHAVIMGRATWDEVGAALADRRNIVVSRRAGLALAGAEVAASVEDAIRMARATDSDPRVIGGAEVARAALPFTSRILLTEVHREVEADTYFALDRRGFRETDRRRGEDPTIEFVTLERDGQRP